jgi:hypothetical protein
VNKSAAESNDELIAPAILLKSPVEPWRALPREDAISARVWAGFTPATLRKNLAIKEEAVSYQH